MLVGTPPFYSDNAFGIYEKILCGKITFPHNFCPVSRDLIKKLLQQDRTKRLGAMKNGANGNGFNLLSNFLDINNLFNYRHKESSLFPRH